MELILLLKKITQDEWRFVGLMILIVLGLVGMPYLFGYLMAGSNLIYTGFHSLAAGDFPVYYSYINQVKQGHFFLKDFFTSEPQIYGTFNLLWFLVGVFARVFHLSPPLAFHLARLALTPLLVIVLFLFLSYFFDDKFKRKLSLIFFLFASGVGALTASYFDRIKYLDNDIYYHWPIDLWMAESNIFLTLYQSPHFIFSFTLLILTFLFFLLAIQSRKWSYSLAAGVTSLILFNFHPYHVVTIWGVPGFYLLVDFLRKKKIDWLGLSYWIILVLSSLPSIIYHYWLILVEPVIALRAIQNVTLSSEPLFVLLGFGFIFIFALFGIYFLFQTKFRDQDVFLIVWLIAGLIFIYLPISFARRLTEGLEAPMVILAIYGLFYFYERWKKSSLTWLAENRYLLIFLFLFLFSFSTLFNIGRDLFYFYNHYPDLYFSREKKSALDWLRKNNKENRVILGGIYDSNLIVGFASGRVFFGHKHETIFPEAKLKELEWFFKNNKNDERRRNFLQKNNIGYLFWTRESDSYGDFSPEVANFLKAVYRHGEVAIYQVW